jgi:hypothetical protein
LNKSSVNLNALLFFKNGKDFIHVMKKESTLTIVSKPIYFVSVDVLWQLPTKINPKSI